MRRRRWEARERGGTHELAAVERGEKEGREEEQRLVVGHLGAVVGEGEGRGVVYRSGLGAVVGEGEVETVRITHTP